MDNLISIQVQQLEHQLLEELELHVFLENVIERNDMKFPGPAHLPHHVCPALPSNCDVICMLVLGWGDF